MKDMAVFKSYLRNLLRRLIELQKAIKAKEFEVAEKLVNELVEDTQKGIED